MQRQTIIMSVMVGGALSFGSPGITAQTFSVEYTTEWQTDFKDGYDWLNLLKASAQVPVTEGLLFEATTISTAKTADAPLVEDLLTYSNIEAGNIPLTFGRLGFGFAIVNAEFFFGINNVNEDYFTSDLTSFFTNSPCGITPTISCNYDIANYPLAAWCVHYRQSLGSVSFQTSLYPGQGYSRILGHENLFTLDLKRDGIFSITSIDYKRNGIYCVLGIALHHGVRIGDADGEPWTAPTALPQKKFSASPWLLSEFDLSSRLGVHAHGSFATVKRGCKAYAGAGVIYRGSAVQPGVAYNFASFTGADEHNFEVTCRIPLFDGIAELQPAVHLIATGGESLRAVGMMRLTLSI